MDRRAMFFLISAVAAALLEPFVPHDDKHPLLDQVGWPLAIVFVVLAALSWLDHWSRHHDHR